MKTLTIMSLGLGLAVFGLAGCSDTATIKTEKTTTTPEGSTTTTQETTIKKTGENPPPAP
jgi:hypothetical protein